MKIKGIKWGQTIEFSKELAIPDSSETIVEVSDTRLLSKEITLAIAHQWLDQTGLEDILTLMRQRRAADVDQYDELIE